MENNVLWEKVVWFFHDLIFMHLFGWGMNPLYNFVEQKTATIVAKIMVFIVETAFYAILIILIIKLFDYLLSKRKNTRERRLENNLKKIERNRRIRERYNTSANKDDAYKDYDDELAEGEYKDYDDI